MNEYVRKGKGDEYVEVCRDWAFGEIEPILWMFKECLGEDITDNDSFRNKIKEVFEIGE